MEKPIAASVGVLCVVLLALCSGCAGTRSTCEVRFDEDSKLNVVAKMELVR